MRDFRDKLALRAECASRYARTRRPYVWPVEGVEGLRVAPFHMPVSEGTAHFDRDHAWHMTVAERLAATGKPLLAATRARRLALDNADTCADTVARWDALTGGGEDMVVKPPPFVPQGPT